MRAIGPLPASAPRREGPEKNVTGAGAEAFGLALLLAVNVPVPAAVPKVESTGVPLSHALLPPGVPVIDGSGRAVRDGDASIQPIGEPEPGGTAAPAEGIAAAARGEEPAVVVQEAPELVTIVGSRASASHSPAAPDSAAAGRERPEAGSSPAVPQDTAGPPASPPDGGGFTASATPPYAGPVGMTVDSGSSPRAVPTGVQTAAVPDPSGAGQVPARPGVDQVTLHLDRESGFEGRVRIQARGDSVRASIVPANPEAARGLERGLGELERALAEHGFTHARVSVLAVAAGGEPATAGGTRPERRGESSDERDGRRPPHGDPRDPANRRSNRNPTHKERER